MAILDYGKKDPSLGWRFTDAWLSMAGNGDKGIPNGLPVDEWGIRVNDKSQPVGSCVARGGDTNGPAAVYSITKYLEWLKKYAPPEAQGMTFGEAGPLPAQGSVAQQIFWYHRVHGRHRERRPAGGECRWHAQVAHGAVAAWRLLEGRHEARLPGRWLLDDPQSPRPMIAPRPPGFMRSSWCPRLWIPRRAMWA